MDNKKKPLKMFLQVLKLFFSENNQTETLVQKSYDHISTGYDETWTHHMRDLTSVLIDKLDILPNQTVIDLTCGTGYATQQIADKTGIKVIGVDNSSGMLEQARQNCSESCDFIHSDILEYLKDSKNQVDFFLSRQVQEEQIKAHLITESQDWENEIVKIEKHSYFKGQVLFVFEFSKISKRDGKLIGSPGPGEIIILSNSPTLFTLAA